MGKPNSVCVLILVYIASSTTSCSGNDRVEFVPHPQETTSPEDPLPRRIRETVVDPIPLHGYENNGEASGRVLQSLGVPKLVQMLSSFDLSGMVSSNADPLLRAPKDIPILFFFTEPLWDRSLKRIEDFVAVTRELKQLSVEIKALFDGNLKIMDAMTKDTHTNFIGFYN